MSSHSFLCSYWKEPVCVRRETRHFSQQITQLASWPQKCRGKGVQCNHFSALWLLNPLSFLSFLFPSNHNCWVEKRCRRHRVSQLPCLFVSRLISPWRVPNVCVCARVCCPLEDESKGTRAYVVIKGPKIGQEQSPGFPKHFIHSGLSVSRAPGLVCLCGFMEGRKENGADYGCHWDPIRELL